MKTSRKILYTILSLGLGTFFIVLMFYLVPVTPEQIVSKLDNINPIYIFLICLSTFFNFWCLSLKWKLVIQGLTSDQKKPQKFYLFYIALGSFIGLVTPRQLSMLGLQSIVIRTHNIGSLFKGFLTSIYNQLFNLLIPLFILPSALLLIFKYITLPTAITVSVATLLIAPFLIIRFQKPALELLYRIYQKIKKNSSKQKKINSTNSSISDLSVLKPRLTLILYILTILFHISLITRSYLIVQSANLSISIWQIAFGNMIVFVAMLIGLTPGNLGMMEWGWIGILELFQVPIVDAVSFALLQRILLTISIFLVFTCVWLAISVGKFFDKIKIKFSK